MIKKYDDNYINLSSIDSITKIEECFMPKEERWYFTIHIKGNYIEIKDDDKMRLQLLRDRIVKDWMEVRNARD